MGSKGWPSNFRRLIALPRWLRNNVARSGAAPLSRRVARRVSFRVIAAGPVARSRAGSGFWGLGFGVPVWPGCLAVLAACLRAFRALNF